MMEFYVSGQSLKVFSPALAADSLNYLTAKLNFTDADWDGASKWLHFRSGDRVYDIQLDEDDCISADKRLNLGCGLWEIYLTGTRGDSRLTTLPVMLRVYASGLIDAPLHELPLSVAEQLDYNARQALLLAQTVKDKADSGGFDGADGAGLSPLGHFESAEELAALIPQPAPGDAYSVGVAPPYNIFVWDGVNHLWRDHGQLQGVPGEKGEAGAVFIPYVDANGNLSWMNSHGLENPAARNIRGPAGADGAVGPAGPGAYEKAKAAGYTGTEAGFYAALSAMPYHNARHLPQGADPIEVQTGNIADKAVTAEKIADSARTRRLPLSVAGEWTGEEAPYSLSIGLSELRGDELALLRFVPPEDFTLLEAQQQSYNCIYDAAAGAGLLTLYAKEKPDTDFAAVLEVHGI